MSEADKQISKLRLELRRGIIVLAVLSQLNEPRYGYSLIQSLAEKGLEVEEGTLYPLLRRLEKQGLVKSEWQVGESRPRKYYVITPDGQKVFSTLSEDWFDTVEIMRGILQGDQDE